MRTTDEEGKMEDQMTFDKLLPKDIPTGKLKKVPLDEIPAELPGPAPTDELVESVRRFGVVLPVVLLEKAHNRYDVVDGRRRIAAAREAGLTDVPARVYVDADLVMMDAVLGLSLNRLRSDNPAAELEAIERLIESGASMLEIRKATGLPAATIAKRLRLQALKEPLLAALARGKISVSVAEAAAGLSAPAQERLVERLETTGRLTMPDVREQKSARAADELAQLPVDVFLSEDGTWRDQVIARCLETLKVIPPDEEEARKRLQAFVEWLETGG